ncbi:MAG TPA: helix-turn-helix domain-containing protein [Leptolyngbyaceae cyanobacterium M33_DOE_097]|uniref:Helix-turn-helix domain-containing protein n=1 Tax=Oscillatoriales cyanobacterium SpSt-418 TaxID=2282169 RepID=A0A7C3PFS8_9CYAN|nr:helix-turn-helix domain-containing protein [Leptolyngbyaceae cyanobacterium M33_DOE_097]
MTQATVNANYNNSLNQLNTTDELQAVLGQIEAELCNSEIYQRVVANLQALPTEIGQRVQRMMRAIAREAICTTARNLSTQLPAPIEPQSVSAVSEAIANTPIATAEPKVKHITHPKPPAPPLKRATVATKKAKPLSKKEKAAISARQAWEEQLQEIVGQLREARLAKSLSLDHVHLRTQIPVYQLEALELGDLHRLPEPIYIRGFIRQIGNVLGLNGVDLANRLSLPDTMQTVLPSWQTPSKIKTGGVHLHPAHLYVGYAALMAGGMGWVSYQMAPKMTPQSTPGGSLTAPSEVQPADKAAQSDRGQSQVSQAGGTLPVNIAPPENASALR